MKEVPGDKLGRAVDAHQPGSGTSIQSFVQVGTGTGGAPPEPSKMTTSRIPICRPLVAHQGGMRAQPLLEEPVLTAQEHAAD